jgi:uncharacterized protein YndB with AHSA1/START domain
MPREFECRREVELDATPEQVWEAVATAAGNEAWLFPNELPPADGSTDANGSRITANDPPHHFAVRTEQGDWFNALEFVIEGRGGGKTLLRYAHSGVFQDDWDTQYDAVQAHTDFYLHTLGEYLRHFAGRTATYVGDVPGGIAAPAASTAPDGLDRLKRALGVDGAGEGDRVELSPDGLGPMHGVVDYARGPFLGIRTDDALIRFFGRYPFGGPVAVAVHAFDDVDAEALAGRWRDWLATVY